MTKPQALPFLVPFAAWFWARGGWRGFARAAAIGLASSSSCGCRSSRPAGPATTWTTSPSTRATSSRSCRSGPGTCGGSSRTRRSAAQFVAGRRRGPRADHVPPHRLRADGPAVARRCVAGPARSATADVDPGPRRVDAGRVLLPDLDARALRVRRADLPDAAARRARIAWLSVAFGVVFTLNLLRPRRRRPCSRQWLPFGSLVSIVGSFAMIAITFLRSPGWHPRNRKKPLARTIGSRSTREPANL